MRIDDIYVDCPPEENPDWDYARNRRVLLKRGRLDWSCSIYSVYVPLNDIQYCGPNRDCPYEGLLCRTDEKTWKLIDGIHFESGYLKPKFVRVYPHKARYVYENEKGEEVSFEFNLTSSKLVIDSNIEKFRSILLVDIRESYKRGDSANYDIDFREKTIIISKMGFGVEVFPIEPLDVVKRSINWIYKYDDGYRFISNGKIYFVKDTREILLIGPFEAFRTINIRPVTRRRKQQGKKDEDLESRLNKIVERIIRLSKTVDKRLIGMILSLDGYLSTILPDAGAWWFKNFWLRDFSESVLWNLETIKILDRTNEVLETFSIALSTFNRITGLLPNRIPKVNAEDEALDSTLLTYLSALSTGNEEISYKAIDCLSTSIKIFSKNKPEKTSNSACILENGLISCLPWHSWIDSRVSFDGLQSVSTRILRGLEEKKELKKFISRAFFILPEVNAYWIKTLEKALVNDRWGLLDRDFISSLTEKAKNSFRKLFFEENSGLVYDFATIDGYKCDIEASTSIVAICLLADEFSLSELERFWNRVVKRILVTRRGKAFGVIVRRFGDSIFLGDKQYHGMVVWPRDIPYLIRLASALGKRKIVKELIDNLLEVLVTESSIFHVNELYALAEGENPCQGGSKDPVPVKNISQLWNFPCDVILKALGVLTESDKK